MNSFTATHAPANPNWIRHAVLTLTLAAALVLGLTAAVGTTPASAMTPPQTTLKSTMNTLYWELDGFWRYALGNSANYASPTIDYYDSPYTPPGCGAPSTTTRSWRTATGTRSGSSTPSTRARSTTSATTRPGSSSPTNGVTTSRTCSGWTPSSRRTFALASSTPTAWPACSRATNTPDGGKLDAHDYWEGISSLDDHFPNEGGGNGYPLKSDRKDSYWAGFNTYSLATCQQVVPAAGASTTVVISNTGGGPANVKRGQKAVRPALGKPSKHKASKRHMEVILG